MDENKVWMNEYDIFIVVICSLFILKFDSINSTRGRRRIII